MTKQRPASRPGRTPLFSALQRTLKLAHLANQNNTPTSTELVQLSREPLLSRRRFLRGSAAAALLLGGGSILNACTPTPTGSTPTMPNGTAASLIPTSSSTNVPTVLLTPKPAQPRIAIVGAGVGGLNTAYKLNKAGLTATVYDGSKRVGGRVFTAHDIMGAGLSTELGGEFIDTGHAEMLALAKELGLELIDTKTDSESKLRMAYYFGNTSYTEEQVTEMMRPLIAKIKEDYDGLGEVVNYQDDGGAKELDNLSIAAYLDRIGANGWPRKLIESAYVGEYGLELDQQSSLNFIFLIGLELESSFQIFGESDERFKIKGGNQQIPNLLARHVGDQIMLEHRLVAIKEGDKGYTLSFSTGGATQDIEADIVVLALPFTLMREVDMKVTLPDVKRKAIAELGYGTNAKVLAGFQKRLWRDQGFDGEFFTDEVFQNGWDSSRQQDPTEGSITFFLGGKVGAESNQGTAAEQVARFLPGLEKIYPGISALHNGKAERMHWPTYEWTKASYACYKPGQWTSIAGAEGEAVGNLFFAGEHCSYDYQGYMNGAADTGRTTAEAIIARVMQPAHRRVR